MSSFQSFAPCNKEVVSSTRLTFCGVGPAFTKTCVIGLARCSISLHFVIWFSKTGWQMFNTESCRHVYRPCSRATGQPASMCEREHFGFPQSVQPPNDQYPHSCFSSGVATVVVKQFRIKAMNFGALVLIKVFQDNIGGLHPSHSVHLPCIPRETVCASISSSCLLVMTAETCWRCSLLDKQTFRVSFPDLGVLHKLGQAQF